MKMKKTEKDRRNKDRNLSSKYLPLFFVHLQFISSFPFLFPLILDFFCCIKIYNVKIFSFKQQTYRRTKLTFLSCWKLLVKFGIFFIRLKAQRYLISRWTKINTINALWYRNVQIYSSILFFILSFSKIHSLGV